MIAQALERQSAGIYDRFVVPVRRGQSIVPAAGSAGIGEDFALQTPTVFVVDPDPSTGNTVKDLLRGYDITVQAFLSGREFFAAYAGDEPGCLVLEQRIFDISGLQIQRHLAEQNQRLPLIYVTSGVDVSTAVALMRGGAINVLEKPLRPKELLNAIQEGVVKDQSDRRKEDGKRRIRESIALLTRKERQLVSLIAHAKSTQAVALELGICARAVELRRRGVMRQIGIEVIARTVKICDACMAGISR